MLQRNFPQEEKYLNKNLGGIERLVQRVYRWDTRILLGLASLLGRPLFRFFVVENGGRIVATTLLTFGPPTAYLSSVMVEAEHRRHGYARRMLEACALAAPQARCRFLVLDVLSDNTPARTLYGSAGYAPLREQALLVRDIRPADASQPLPPGLRPLRSADGPALHRIALATLPPAVAQVLSGNPRKFFVGPLVGRLLAHTTEAWVSGPARNPTGFVRAIIDPTSASGHLVQPVLSPGVDSGFADRWLTGVMGWFARHGIRKVVSEVPDHNRQAVDALHRIGFNEALRFVTLWRELPAA